jgi:secreted trypsin-like serine protease
VAKVKIRIGDWNLRDSSDGVHELRGVSKVIKHKYFNVATFTNDIALLKLDRPVQFTNRIQPICLPSTDVNLENRELTVAGWGRTSFNGKTSPTLLKVDVRVWDNPSCENVYRGIAPGGILNSMMCAGDRGATCKKM